jgi:HAE1 family hydrophobic/amphiphilic exporter-1
MLLLKKRTHNRFIDGFNTLNLAQGKYQNLLGKNQQKSCYYIALVGFCAGTWLISSTGPFWIHS